MRVFNGAFGGDWEDWCDKAANMWPGSDREDLRAKCKNQPLGPLSMDPKTQAGHATRGLPANFSTDPKIVSSGAAGALLKDVTSDVKTAAADVKTAQQLVNVVTGGGSVMMTPAQAQAYRQQQLLLQQRGMQGGFFRVHWKLVAGLALAGVASFILLGDDAPAPVTAVAGFLGFHRRRRRRSRR
jgi:hypothetical protein